jgi:hypothetical protein
MKAVRVKGLLALVRMRLQLVRDGTRASRTATPPTIGTPGISHSRHRFDGFE